MDAISLLLAAAVAACFGAAALVAWRLVRFHGWLNRDAGVPAPDWRSSVRPWAAVWAALAVAVALILYCDYGRGTATVVLVLVSVVLVLCWLFLASTHRMSLGLLWLLRRAAGLPRGAPERRLPVAIAWPATAGLCVLGAWAGLRAVEVAQLERAVPADIPLGDAVYYRAPILGGCGGAVFRLPPQALDGIVRLRLAYFRGASTGRGGTPPIGYEPWSATPMSPQQAAAFVDGLRCMTEGRPELFRNLSDRPTRPGAYFTGRSDWRRSDQLLVVPQAGVLVYFYREAD